MSAYQMGQVGTKGSLWQNYMSAWFRALDSAAMSFLFRVWNDSLDILQQYEKLVFYVLTYLYKEKRSQDHKSRAESYNISYLTWSKLLG